MAKLLMIQGTASSVGKSTIATGIGRILWQDGHTVAPFKAQNMSDNAHILDDGLEMARSQAIAAFACEIEPHYDMNPILLKLVDGVSEVIISGKSIGRMDSDAYKTLKQNIWPQILEPFKRLENKYDMVVLEGAGSPVEMNLKEGDIVNMSMAQKVNSPVLLVSDIDRGGVFASVKGTLDLLSQNERSLVKGIIINKCIGRMEFFTDVKNAMEEITNLPVIGMVPYIKLDIEDEDSLFDTHSGPKIVNTSMSSTEYRTYMNTQFDLLAKTLREYVDMEKIYEIMEKGV